MSGVQQAVFQNQRSFVAPLDAQFNYVTMLLHGDGTNGAQNNTFLDSSTNNFTITRNGNTTQGSFSPYGSNWSNFFNGTDATLDFPNSSNVAFGTGSFTIEFWINGPLNNDKFILGGRNAITTMHITTGGSSSTAGVLRYVGTSTIVSSNVITDNTWHHCAIVRNGSSNITLYVDGVSVGTGTDTSNYTQASGTWYIARNDLSAASYLNAYISNLRIVKGTAVYTSAFTPSTTPLTAISGTSLLTCQSNRFIDNSSNAFALTVTGTPSVQRFNPFGASTAYSTSVIGGSGYFDGSGDYLALPSTSQATLTANSNFTFETYVYLTGYSGTYNGIWGGNSGDLVIAYSSSSSWGIYPALSGSAPFMYSGMTVLNGMFNRWAHVALTRSGNSWNLWVDGVSVASATQTSTSIPNTTKSLGSEGAGANPMKGYMTDARYTNTALYSTTFTPPSTPLTTTVSSGTVKLLANYTNGAIFDNAMMNDLETVGNAQISTSVVKYGTGSLAFDGTGDYLAGPASLTGVFGTGNFTIEAWIYTTASSGTQCVFDTRFTDSSTAGCFFGLYSSNAVLFYTSATVLTGGTVTANTWNHIAAVRSGTTVTVYLNGTSVASGTRSNDFTQNYVQIGGSPFVTSSTPNSFFGYIDDFRITKGYARYTATFTPPTAAFPDTGPI